MRFKLPRVIPCLLLRENGLVKTTRFRKPRYIGDPINAVRILNEKEVDELVIVDISATVERRKPAFDLLAAIASECFMPLTYGGGIRDLADVRRIIASGVEKVLINSAAINRPDFVEEVAKVTGSASVVVSLDVKKSWTGNFQIFTDSGTKNTQRNPVETAAEMARRGAGEILLNSIDRDGTGKGYDLKLVKQVVDAVNIPVIACGGAGNSAHLLEVVNRAGVTAVAAGSIFVFHGKHQAVLISYPTQQELKAIFN